MLDLVVNLGSLALDAYNNFENDEEDPVLPSLLEAGVELALKSGDFLYSLFSNEEREDGNDEDDDEIINFLCIYLRRFFAA
jgi:hypothetical protein